MVPWLLDAGGRIVGRRENYVPIISRIRELPAVTAVVFTEGPGGDIDALRLLNVATRVGRIAEVHLIVERTAAGERSVTGDAAIRIALVDVGEGLSEVGQLGDDRVTQRLQTHDHADHQDGADQHDFR